MAMSVDLNVSCFCVITGASQGIGRALAVEFSKKMGPKSVILLVARNMEGLLTTKSLIDNTNVETFVKSVDLSSASTGDMETMMVDILKSFDQPFDLHIIIHNAGSIGDTKLTASELDNLQYWRDYFDLNVFNVASLNCVFVKLFKEHEDKIVIINITSLCGSKPFAGLSIYGSGKAAREMYFSVLAKERPNLKVLNYSPGPVQTAMIDTVIENTTNADLKTYFVTSKESNQLLQPEETVKKCLDVLTKGAYSSGTPVDYFDRV